MTAMEMEDLIGKEEFHDKPLQDKELILDEWDRIFADEMLRDAKEMYAELRRQREGGEDDGE